MLVPSMTMMTMKRCARKSRLSAQPRYFQTAGAIGALVGTNAHTDQKLGGDGVRDGIFRGRRASTRSHDKINDHTTAIRTTTSTIAASWSNERNHFVPPFRQVFPQSTLQPFTSHRPLRSSRNAVTTMSAAPEATTTLSMTTLSMTQHRRSLASLASGGNSSSRASSSSSSTTTNPVQLTPFLLADIGEGIKEVELLQWYVQVGDVVQQFDKICEVQSDKATVEITSRYDGTVHSLQADPGGMIQVGQPLLYFSTTTTAATTDHSPLAATSSSSNPVANVDTTADTGAASYAAILEDAAATANVEERLSIPTVASQYHLRGDDDDDDHDDNHSGPAAVTVHASPAVRKLGREYGLNVATIKGTGPSGRVLKSDVITYLQEMGRWKKESLPTTTAAAADQHQQQTTTVSTDSSSSSAKIITAEQKQDEIVQLRGYNRMMVKSMTAALQTPHMCFGDEILVDQLLSMRQQLNGGTDAPIATHKTKISLLALLIKAVSCALSDHPNVNAVVHSVEDCTFVQRCDHNIGVAMDTPRGLVVPVLAQCQNKSVTEIQNELNRFKTMAVTGKFTTEDLQDATFTVSNIGSVGAGTYMQPVLAPPALAMGAWGRVKTLPRYRANDDDAAAAAVIYPASVLTVTWAADHRFLDGATLGRFHCRFQQYVEQPFTILAKLR